MLIGWACGTYWGKEDAYRVLMGEPERNTPHLEGLGRNWEIILKHILTKQDE